MQAQIRNQNRLKRKKQARVEKAVETIHDVEDLRSESEYTDEEEKIQKVQKVRGKDDRRSGNGKILKVRAEDSHRRNKVKRHEVSSEAKDRSSYIHGKFRNKSYQNEDYGSRSRSALVANLIASKSVLLERERASDEVMERAIEVALLNERNAQLKSRLRGESKAHFDKKLANSNLNYLYDIF